VWNKEVHTQEDVDQLLWKSIQSVSGDFTFPMEGISAKVLSDGSRGSVVGES
jgi:hypothetical protein